MRFGKNNKTPFIIAEIGINHNGDMDIAKKLISMAYKTGCDAVKFQKRTIDLVYTQEYLASHRESPWGKTQRDQKEGLEFTEKDYDEIDRYCKELGIMWSASAWDYKSQEFLNKYDLPFNKIASAMIRHKPFLDQVANERRHTFISTGMTEMEDIDAAVGIFTRNDCPFTLFHCVSTYPCPAEDSNLLVIKTLQDRYRCPVGYSGHEKGVLPTVLAVSLGATAIERHITLDRTMYGSDQAASLEKKGLKLVVRDSREAASIMGSGVKTFSEEEMKVAKKLRYFES